MTPVDLSRHAPLSRLRLASEILAAYVRVRRTMRATEPEEAVSKLRAYARRHPLAGDQDREIVAGWRLARAVMRTLQPLPTDSRCLMRSLTLLTLMERRSLSPTLVIAVKPQPFEAHAWIELHGQELLPGAKPGFERIVEL
ncbi:MAG TPA: lasso peptide biosynthesis B2 protein [Solirubrobacteraceae bacterium]